MTATDTGYSVFGRASKVEIVREPFPHAIIHDALPSETYEALAASFPSLEYVAGDGPLDNNRAYLRQAANVLGDPSVAEPWQRFFAHHTSPAFYAEILALWRDEILASFPGVEENFGKPLAEFDLGVREPGKETAAGNLSHDLVLDCLFGVNSPVAESTASRGPHIDSARKLFSALIYFRDPEDDCTGGEFELYEQHRYFPRSKMKHVPASAVGRVKTVPYRANTCVTWLNTGTAIHGVSPRSVTPRERRYIAITGECYGGAKTDGYFAQREDWNRPTARLRAALGL